MEQARLLEISDDLHARVQLFAAGSSTESFEQLALQIARFQAQASPSFQRLLRARAAQLHSLTDIAALPSQAFRLTRVASFDASLDQVRFYTSGTTGSERGCHALRRTDSYEQLSLRFGRQALLPRGATTGAVVLALAAPPQQPGESSLSYMMQRFMAAFDGQPLDAEEASFDETSSARWLMSERGVSLSGLRRACAAAGRRGKPVLLLGAAFAFVQLLDDLDRERVPLPPGSLVMQTGGFKGRSREVSPVELRADLCAALALKPDRVVGEYGMTELTSQLYEATIRESELGERHAGARAGLYFEPPWLRVAAVDPVSLQPVPEGETGLARFIDLGNVDSAISVVTQDLVRRVAGGIELLGRQPGATPRGCSLAIEALLHG